MKLREDMNVLVVGGAGYIGGWVVDALTREKISVTVYDNLLYEHQYLKPVSFIRGDIRDQKKLMALLPDFTHVIWLAAIVGDGACAINPQITREVNADAVRWLAAVYSGSITFTSTCSVYGSQDMLLDELSPTHPLSLYAETKREAESILQKHPDAVIFRLGTAFGLADTYSRLRMDLAVNNMTANAITKGKLTVFGGNQWRPFIHVKDIGEAIVRSLGLPLSGVYNLATYNYQIRDLGQRISALTGCPVAYTEQKFEDERNYRVATDKIAKSGLLEKISPRDIEVGVKEITDVIRSGRVKDTEHPSYFNHRHLAHLG